MSARETDRAVVSTPPGVILVGNPNVGKSVLFGLLTRTYVIVSNYPGTTVEIVRGSARFGNGRVEIVDTPGVNSLLPESEDERVTRDVLLSKRASCVVQVADAKNLRRSLLLTVELAEMGLPMVLDLNMLDEALARGVEIDVVALARILGIPVVPTVATRRQGLGALCRAVEGGGGVARLEVRYDPEIEGAVEKVAALLPEDLPITRRSLALMLLARDPALDGPRQDRIPAEHRAEIETISRDLDSRYPLSLPYAITSRRYEIADRVLEQVYRSEPAWRRGVAARLDRLGRHRGAAAGFRVLLVLLALVFLGALLGPLEPAGWPVAIAAAAALVLAGLAAGALTSPGWGLLPAAGMLYLVYLFVGSFGAGVAVDFLETTVFGEWIGPALTSLVTAVLGEPSAAGPVARFFHDFLVGPYGAATMALSYAIAIILPIVGTFFLAFGVLEDSGYLPRLAVMSNRLFRMMGLNGKAVLPMVLGLGCDTMATLTARILPTRKERIVVTLLLALGVPCSAQLGIILGILAEVSIAGTIWWLGTILLVLLVVGRLASKVIPGDAGDFILELPPLRVPKLGNVLRKTVARLEWYVKEAVPLFFFGTAVLFALDRVGGIEAITRVSRPLVVGFLGLPAGTSEVFLMGFLRRDYGAAGLLAMWKAGGLTPTQAVVALTTITLFIPCLAHWLVMLKERGWRMTLAATAFILPFALLVGGAMNGLFQWLHVTLTLR